MNAGKFAKNFAMGLGLSACLLAGASAQTIKIGVIAALTGGAATWGLATAESAKIAAAEVNANGGLDIGGKKQLAEVIAYDDQYKAADAVAANNRLTRQEGVKYVIIMSSASALALKQNLEDDKVLGLTSYYSAKVAAAFAQVLPMPSIQGDELALGGKKTFGVDQQLMTTNYIAVIKNGQPVVVGENRESKVTSFWVALKRCPAA